MSNVQMTQVAGYYNGNKWPIQLVISRYNLTLHLQPSEYILAKNGQVEKPADTTAYVFNEGLWHRKINDPFFEAYASTKQLKRELVDKPVSVVLIPIQEAQAPQMPVVCDGQAVRCVTEWRKDSRGLRQPVIPMPRVSPPQAVNKTTVTSMSLEEARKRGFVGKTRMVPEDYGLTDTDGTPPSNAPRIRYSIDSHMNKPVAPLPEELTQVVEKDVPPEQAALKRQLQSQLRTASAHTPAAESPTGFLNAATSMAPAGTGMRTGKATPLPAAAPEAELPAPELEEPPIEEAEAVPQEQEEQVQEEQGVAEEVPAPVPQRPAILRQPTPRNKYVCAACRKPFPFRSQLKRHAEQQHANMVPQILAPYPEQG